MRLSIIIPSYKDPFLQKTIDSLLDNSELGSDIEIIAVLDGYWPNPQLADDRRVKLLHLGQNRGMRDAINAGVAISTGEYIMRVDSHCIFGSGYDRLLLERIRDNWVVTPRRYFLDVEKWQKMDLPPVDYEKLIIDAAGGQFAGQVWDSRAIEREHKLVDDTMAIHGSCWVMKRTWWDEAIGELQTEGYGSHEQDAEEVAFKTWKADGRLMTNKNTWFAHKHGESERARNYDRAATEAGRTYSMNLWKNYYENVIRAKWKI